MADFPLPMSEAFLGTLDNPAISQSYRKAVIRPAPATFTAVIHPPRKQGANFHYGMRIIPSDVPSSPVESSAKSTRSTKSSKNKEYDIFRRWDDCLDFQRTLEGEFEFISRRRRKGQPALNHHAKETLYPTQRAASFDSLPLGPDPSSIALDVHEYLPKLTKKSTLFRATHTTISQRGEEFKALIEALLSDDAHSTVQELRTVPVVRDFFALWRRDKEAERRSQKTYLGSPPLPEPHNIPDQVAKTIASAVPSSPAPKPTPQKQQRDYLAEFLHAPVTSTPKSPKPAARNSYATPRPNDQRPSTANPDQYNSSRHLNGGPFLAPVNGTPISGPPSPVGTTVVHTNLAPVPGTANTRFGRSHTVPYPGQVEPLDADAVPRTREPLLLRSLSREAPASTTAGHPPMRKVSSPELIRPSTGIDRRNNARDQFLGVVQSERWMPQNQYQPQPLVAFPLGNKYGSQPGAARKATLRDASPLTSEEQERAKPLTSFPFDHPPESPVTPGFAGHGVGRSGGRRLDSLAVLDPEMYSTLAERFGQPPSQPATTISRPTSAGTDGSQAIPRARKTPPIQDPGNRTARFFVDDPVSGGGLVDVAGGPPPRSPISATMPVHALNSEHDKVYGSVHSAEDHEETQFGQVAGNHRFQELKLSQPPQRRHPVSSLSVAVPIPELEPTYYTPADQGRAKLSIVSGTSIPSLSSPNKTSSWSSTGSPLSPSGAIQRYRSQNSLVSISEQQQRRLSLDSLMMTDTELPYNVRNLTHAPPRYAHKNKSTDAIFQAANGSVAHQSVATPTARGYLGASNSGASNSFGIGSGGGRGSYSSQETDSTGFDETSGVISSGSSLYAPVPSRYHPHGMPPSKANIAVPKSTPPPPRPPRSVLRNSSQFSAGVMQRLDESTGSTPIGNSAAPDTGSERPHTPFNGLAKHDTHDFIDSYFPSPKISHATLEAPVAPFAMMGNNQAAARDSNMSTFTNIAQYYQSIPEQSHSSSHVLDLPHRAGHLSTNTTALSEFEAASLPPTPFSTTFLDLTAHNNVPATNPRHPSQGYANMINIKAIHAPSDTILLFKVPKSNTSLADLRVKIARKFREAGVPNDTLKTVALQYIPPLSRTETGPATGRKRSQSVTSVVDVNQMVDLQSEVEWQKALSVTSSLHAINANTKIIIKVD
ncbi:hypothetical protein FRC14_007405 [Serendipita sp. 396]|nr:hypothetical protein FRC14_007405 [Serendipita sp. 396]